MKPFLKWAGGKRWLVRRISNLLPPYRQYYEPFLGSGALFFAIEPESAVLSDTNPELVNCYRCVRNRWRSVVKVLTELKVDTTTYYKTRERMDVEEDRVRRAAYFIYLNKTCWNGLYRVNRDGKFNVPIGKHIRPNYRVFDEEHLKAASQLLKRAEILCCDFEHAVSAVRGKQHFVYFDPPYITTHITNGFTKYNSALFKESDELRLAQVAAKLIRRGVGVMVSNAAHPLIRQLYDGDFYKTQLSRTSRIAGDKARRGMVGELLVTSFPLDVV